MAEGLPFPEGGSPVTWRRVLDAVTDALTGAGVAAPGSEARWMLEEASGLTSDELFARLGEDAPRLPVQRIQAMVARRLAGEPLQYVLGSWAFRLLDLMVDRRVLIPRPETEVVVDHVLAAVDDLAADPDRVAGRPLRVVDLGTGSGAIALAVAAERPGVEVHATDRSAAALEVARANLAGLGRAGTAVSLHAGSWFSALPLGLRGEVDVVVSNPPYVAAGEELPAEVADWEPTDALVAGPEGTEDLAHLVAEARGWLRPGGVLVLEMAPHQTGEVAALAREAGYEAVRVEPDHAGRARALVARRPR